MARKCASAAILETLRDPRVVTMPAAAQLLWIRVVTAMQNSNISVLRFGNDIMNQTGIALFVAIAETEIETHLKTLIERNLLARDADGAIECPMLVQAVSRSEINRINGSKGGRPRKDGSIPGQSNLMLEIKGGKMESEKTEIETKPLSESGAAENTTYLSSNKESKVSIDKRWLEIVPKAMEAMGFDEAKWRGDRGIIRQWVADGADEAMILDIIRTKKNPNVTTFNYFTKAIADRLAAKPKAVPQWEREWTMANKVWEVTRKGPRPSQEEFKQRFAA